MLLCGCTSSASISSSSSTGIATAALHGTSTFDSSTLPPLEPQPPTARIDRGYVGGGLMGERESGCLRPSFPAVEKAMAASA